MKKTLIALVLLTVASATSQSYGGIPRDAIKYKRDLIRHSQNIVGLNAPIALFASQIHQESYWNFRAKSKYAHGLTQFTPSTADWIVTVFPGLKSPDVFNPMWSIRAMIRYDMWLHKRIKANNECDKWAMVLSSYNGGLGWLLKDKNSARRKGLNPYLWWDNVSTVSNRAGWAYRENRDYPYRILYKHQPKYKMWGTKYVC